MIQGKLLFTDNEPSNNVGRSKTKNSYKPKLLFNDDDEVAQEKPTEQSQQKPQEQSWVDYLADSPVNEGILGAGDAIRNLLSLGYANPNPTNTHSTAYDVGHLAGDIGSFIGGGSALKAAPYVRAIPQTIEKIPKVGSLVSRLLGSTAFDAAQDKENRLGGAIKGAESGAIGEAIGAPFRALGWTAEKYNPMKFAELKQKEIAEQAQKHKEEMQKHFNSAITAAGETKIPSFENKEDLIEALKNAGVSKGRLTIKANPLGFTQEQLRYFTPNLKKQYQDFIVNPTFSALHSLQSTMGKESSRLSGEGSKIKTHQHLTEARDTLHNKIIPHILGPESQAFEDYKKARSIGREEYYPYRDTKTMKQISEGRRADLGPHDLLKEIQAIQMQRPLHAPLHAGHQLNMIQKALEKKNSTSNLLQGLMPFIGGGIGLTGGPLGAGIGALAAPALLKSVQNRNVKEFSSKRLTPLIRAILASPEFANENLG
jgi:hypothetical protein